MQLPGRILAIHYVDLHGNLDRTACGEPFDTDALGAETDEMQAPFVTMFLSSVTCPFCRSAIGRKLERIPQPYRDAIWRRIVGLRSWPHHGGDVVRLKGSPPGSYRLRVGPYRAIAAVCSQERRIVVLRVRHRSTAYR